MHFKTMDQSVLLAILAEEEDVLTERARTDAAYYSDVSCPRCGGTCAVVPDVMAMMRAGTTRNKHRCRCTTCGCLFDPVLGIIIELGNLGELEPAVPLIHGDG